MLFKLFFWTDLMRNDALVYFDHGENTLNTSDFEQCQLCCKQLRNHWGNSLLRVVILSGVVLWPGCLWLLRLKNLPPLEQTEGHLQAFTHIHSLYSLHCLVVFGFAAKLERNSHVNHGPFAAIENQFPFS